MIGTMLNLAGLLFTGAGAFVTSQAVIISEAQAKTLSGPYYGGNIALKEALVAQSKAAKYGLLCIVLGTALQVVALLYSLLAP